MLEMEMEMLGATRKANKTRDHDRKIGELSANGLCFHDCLFPFTCPGKAEIDDSKKRPLPMSLPQARRNGLVKNTERGSRVYARSFLHVSLDEFSYDSR